MTNNVIRIAMWSGPRNISTALMRSWGNRADTFVCDEPFYAFYLQNTGLAHPAAKEIIAAQETDSRKVVGWLTGPVPKGRAVFYQKHMAHHILPELSLEWLDAVCSCFLIRESREMLTSLLRIIPEPTLNDTGLPQQIRLFEHVRARTGRTPPVLDSADVLKSPRDMLGRLCEAIDVPFREEMFAWPAGPRDTDGVWAKHWYGAVERTTGFAPYRPKGEEVPPNLTGLLAECQTLYERLYQYRLR